MKLPKQPEIWQYARNLKGKRFPSVRGISYDSGIDSAERRMIIEKWCRDRNLEDIATGSATFSSLAFMMCSMIGGGYLSGRLTNNQTLAGAGGILSLLGSAVICHYVFSKLDFADKYIRKAEEVAVNNKNVIRYGSSLDPKKYAAAVGRDNI